MVLKSTEIHRRQWKAHTNLGREMNISLRSQSVMQISLSLFPEDFTMSFARATAFYK